MRAALFDYELPEELVALTPTEARDGARLLVLPTDEDTRAPLAERGVRDLPALLPRGALVIVNDTRVLKARLLGHKVGGGGKAEIFLVRRVEGDVWLALGRASKSLRTGTRLTLGQTLDAEILGRDDALGLLRVSLATRDGARVDAAIEREGAVPLPPYIKRAAAPLDEERYQTIFAREAGAVAAPTAGLHMSPEILAGLEARGISLAKVTLHVGLGTFATVKTEDLDDHPMHAETFSIPEATVRAVADARARGADVVAIGTTVVRALESAHARGQPGHVRAALAEETRLLIQPGYAFGVVDHLLTNFHLPRSTLLALVCALGGRERVLAAYEHAVRARMRFFSYGDAMLLARREARVP